MTETTPEFSRMIDRRQLTAAPVELVANAAERAALAHRFALVRIDRLHARLSLVADAATISASGDLSADVVQSCAISGDDLPVQVREALAMVFVPQGPATSPGEEVELEAAELDHIPYSGTMFDLGEAVAESLALAIDPYATGPHADAVRQKHGLGDEGPKGPLAAGLAALLGKKD